MAAHTTDALYLGFDLSTQQLKCIAVDSKLKLVYEAKVDFDADFGKQYGITKGVLTNDAEGEVFAPPALWLEAINLVLDRLKDQGMPFGRVHGLSGAGMQHGTVFWSSDAETLMANLDASQSLVEQLGDSTSGKSSAFSQPFSPNWQDASTQEQCDLFDRHLGSPEQLAEVTGSKAHHRFSGPQILRFRTKFSSRYEATHRISLVSSFIASVFLGRVAPIDLGDVGGMNLWDVKAGKWHGQLLELTAGGSGEAAEQLRLKLGDLALDGGGSLGSISPYFVERYGFPADCLVFPSTGDNPSTILALPLRAADAIVSLGTSTTFLMSTTVWRPDPSYHFMPHPTTPGHYMFMLCYKNGSLAREEVRDFVNQNQTTDVSSSTNTADPAKSWERFNHSALDTPCLAQAQPSDPMRLGLYFPRPEIVPNVPAGQWRYLYDPDAQKLSPTDTAWTSADARNIVESQFLSLRLRSARLVSAGEGQTDPSQLETSEEILPAQPRRIYLVGGGSQNAAIAQLAGEVLGGAEGVYRLDIGGNACALGAAYKAVWGAERPLATGDAAKTEMEQKQEKQSFEAFLSTRWDAASFVQKVDAGYRRGVYEQYGRALSGFAEMENRVLHAAGGGGGGGCSGEERKDHQV